MKEKMILIVVGILIALFGVYAFWYYKLSKTVAEDHASLVQVVSFLNQQIAQQQPKQVAPAPAK